MHAYRESHREKKKRPVATMIAAISIAMAVLVGLAAIVAGFNIGRTIRSTDFASVTRMLAGLDARPSTQKGYDLAISIANGQLEAVGDLVALSLELTKLVALTGLALVISGGMFLYAWRVRTRETARESPE